ncbi:MAG: ribonuclease H family protein [Bryobacteraceae bacterium]|nr:ribonuclease H family protein [Bryobacteraceae bacterium]MDW8377198.1 ribonuclease H family protein [Bryobacterales bacterium]
MAKIKTKYYVVWQGRQPGVYASWEQAQAQVSGFAGAKFKGFSSRREAEQAYQESYEQFAGKTSRPAPKSAEELERLGVQTHAVAVDAACAGVPGPMEYRGVWLATGEEMFHRGPYEDGTNNIGEFLALVHALALLERQGRTDVPVYSDSKTALAWVRQGKCRTKHERTPRNEELFRLIERAETWLRRHPVRNPLLKWDTEAWGEVPADFGRK